MSQIGDRLAAAFDERMRVEGYSPVVWSTPPWNVAIEVIRYGWPGSQFMVLCEQPAWMNLAGLWWREP